MRQLFIPFIILITIASCKQNSQTIIHIHPDALTYPKPGWPFQEYVHKMYNAETHTYTTSYNYSNKWDLDGDKKNDSVYFIGNDGGHDYFYLKVILSSDNIEREFYFAQIDMPYFNTIDKLRKTDENPLAQFVVYDFDNDGVLDIFLNLNNKWSSIPKYWKRKGVTSKYVIVNFRNGEISIKNFQKI